MCLFYHIRSYVLLFKTKTCFDSLYKKKYERGNIGSRNYNSFSEALTIGTHVFCGFLCELLSIYLSTQLIQKVNRYIDLLLHKK